MWFEHELSLDAERVPRMPDLLIRVDGLGWASRPGRLAVRSAGELWLVNLDRWTVKVRRCDGIWERSELDSLSSPQLSGYDVRVDALFL